MSMYEKEWECCGDVTITKSWQPEKCPFCTAPPKREWVGLTDEEIAEGAKQSWVDKQAFESAVWWAEEKLKEKNHGNAEG